MSKDSEQSKGGIEWGHILLWGVFIMQLATVYLMDKVASAMAGTLNDIRDVIVEDHYGRSLGNNQ